MLYIVHALYLPLFLYELLLHSTCIYLQFLPVFLDEQLLYTHLPVFLDKVLGREESGL